MSACIGAAEVKWHYYPHDSRVTLQTSPGLCLNLNIFFNVVGSLGRRLLLLPLGLVSRHRVAFLLVPFSLCDAFQSIGVQNSPYIDAEGDGRSVCWVGLLFLE
jgi:hypothetical protein